MSISSYSFLRQTLENEFNAAPHSLSLGSGVRLEFLATGVLSITPAHNEARYRVLISSGIHGNETAPMEIVDQLFTEIHNGDLEVNSELLFVIGNPPAANKSLRFIDENLNRLFTVDGQSRVGSYESQRAELIKTFTDEFFSKGNLPRLHYDLHTAIRGSKFEKFVVYPYREDQQWSLSQLGFLESCGLDAVLLSNKPSTTYSYYTSYKFGADAFTIELGSVKPFGQNDHSKFKKMSDGLRSVISGNQAFTAAPRQLSAFRVIAEVIKLTEEFELHIPDDALNFTEYPKGRLLATDKGYEYRTRQDAERFVFPIKNVPPGNRAMLVVAPTDLITAQVEKTTTQAVSTNKLSTK